MTPNQPLEPVDKIEAGDHVECAKCGEHIATFSKALYRGMPVCEKVFLPREGQGPWRNGEPMNCRKCGNVWFNGYQFLNHVPKEFIN